MSREILVTTVDEINAKIEQLRLDLAAARQERANLIIAQCPWQVGDLLKKRDGVYRVERLEAHAKTDCVTAWCYRRMVTGKFGQALTPLFSNDGGIIRIAA